LKAKNGCPKNGRVQFSIERCGFLRKIDEMIKKEHFKELKYKSSMKNYI
jgi:hypothetical protein